MDFRKITSLFNPASLPVSLSGATLGAMLAIADYHVSPNVVLFLFLTAVLMHMLSSLRENPSGLAMNVARNIRRALSVLAILSAGAAIYFTYGTIFLLDSFILLIAFWFLMNMASRRDFEPSGSNAWRQCVRDVMLYGLAGVCGSYYLCAHTFGSWFLLLPAMSVGMLCAAARQHVNACSRGMKFLQTALVASAWICMTVYSLLRVHDPWHFLFVLTLPMFIICLSAMWKNSSDGTNPYGIIMAVSVFAFSLLSGFGFLVFLL